MARERRVGLDAVEDVEAAVEVLVFAEVEVDGVEDEPDGDVAVEGGDEEPCAEVVTGDISCDALPYFMRSTMGCWFVHEMNLSKD